MARVDDTNLHLLHLLQRDARTSVVDLAHAVGRSESTVRERLSSLQVQGILQGYEVRVDWARIGLPATAVVRAGCDLRKLPDVARRLEAIPNVTKALLLTGRKPVLAILRVRDMAHLKDLLAKHLESEDLLDLEVEIAMQDLVERRPVPILQAVAQELEAA